MLQSSSHMFYKCFMLLFAESNKMCARTCACACVCVNTPTVWLKLAFFSLESGKGGVRVFSSRHLFIKAYSLLCCSNNIRLHPLSFITKQGHQAV